MTVVLGFRPSAGPASNPRRATREGGFAGGWEVLPFGVLIFVIAVLMITNAWAVIDAKLAASAAAREAARAYVEAPTAAAAGRAADSAGKDAFASYGRNPDALDLGLLGGSFARCSRVTFSARYEVPSIALPFGLGFGSPMTVTARHSEIVDPLRSGLPPENDCGF